MSLPAHLLRRAVHPLYRHLETSVHPLRYLFLEITQRCNLRCRHCGSDCSADVQRDELSCDEWLALFKYLGSHFAKDELVLVITGGEPLCAPHLERLLAGLKQSGLTWGMVSNGYALSPARIAKLLDAGLSALTISLDGTRSTHDWLRGVPGSFDRALAGIRAAAAAGVPYLDVVTCVHPRNLVELPQVHAILRDAGVRSWRLFNIFPKGRAAEDPALLLDATQTRVMLDWIAAVRSARLAGPEVQFSCEGYLPGAVDAAVRSEPYFCRAGISIGSVLCDGAISGCPNISRALVQGNVRHDDLRQVWEERFVPFRDRGWMKRGACTGCDAWGRCQGNSLHLWDERQGAPARCYPEVLGAKPRQSRTAA